MQTTIDKGATGEERAVAFLHSKGYRVVERNWKCRAGEIDVVAYDADGSTLCFIEVRSRASARFGHAAEMITARKRAQVSRAAAIYLQHRRPGARRMRFDAVAITGPQIDLIRDAWRL